MCKWYLFGFGLVSLATILILYYRCIKPVKKELVDKRYKIPVSFIEKSGRPIDFREIDVSEFPTLEQDYEIYSVGGLVYAKEKHDSTRREKTPINLDEINQKARERYRPAF